jgi:hypothetical protein
MEAWKFTGAFTVLFAVTARFMTWLVIGEWSPFHDYFLEHLMVKNFVLKLLIIPYVVMLIIKPETDFGDMLVATVVELLQWLLLSFLLALFINFVSGGRQANRSKSLQ